ncbi:haloacid dehalogenase-like hydrolase [bacterium]|nr:haloacid dehalogenase-like hydrolase [bacterium]
MRDIVAIVFDFDDTLAPDSTSGYLADIGVDVPAFWDRANRRIDQEGWDQIPVYLYQMMELSSSTEGPRVTADSFRDWGSRLPLHEGVPSFFDRLRTYLKKISPDTILEFYLISSGIGEILRATPIAKEFRDIFACDFDYDSSGAIVFPKNIVSFTEKTRFLFNISKGMIGEEARLNPQGVNKRFQEGDYRIPFHNMIFVGDGDTDIPCFTLVRRYDGVAMAVYDQQKQHKWGRAWGFIKDKRVSNITTADYREGSPLEIQLKMALEEIVNRGGGK